MASAGQKPPSAVIDEVTDFYKFAKKKDAPYQGTCVFDVKPLSAPAYKVSVRLAPGKEVEVWRGLPPDKKYSAYIEMGEEEFFKVYSGVGWSEVAAMVLAGRIKVHWLRFDELRNFSLSYDFSAKTWLSFFHSRGEYAREAELWRRQWRAADAKGWLVNSDGELVDPSTLSPDEKEGLVRARAQWMSCEAADSSLPAIAGSVLDPVEPPAPNVDASGTAATSDARSDEPAAPGDSTALAPLPSCSDSASQSVSVPSVDDSAGSNAPSDQSVMPVIVGPPDGDSSSTSCSVASISVEPAALSFRDEDLRALVSASDPVSDTSSDNDDAVVEPMSEPEPPESVIADAIGNIASNSVSDAVAPAPKSSLNVSDMSAIDSSLELLPIEHSASGAVELNSGEPSAIPSVAGAILLLPPPSDVANGVADSSSALASEMGDVLALTSASGGWKRGTDAEFTAMLRGILDQSPPSQELVGSALLAQIDVHSTTLHAWLHSRCVPLDDVLRRNVLVEESVAASPTPPIATSEVGDAASRSSPTFLEAAGGAVSSVVALAYSSSVSVSAALWTSVVGGASVATSIAAPVHEESRPDALRSAGRAYSAASFLTKWAHHFRAPSLHPSTDSQMLAAWLRQHALASALGASCVGGFATWSPRRTERLCITSGVFPAQSYARDFALPDLADLRRGLVLSAADFSAGSSLCSLGSDLSGLVPAPSSLEVLVNLCDEPPDDAVDPTSIASRDEWLHPIAEHWPRRSRGAAAASPAAPLLRRPPHRKPSHQLSGSNRGGSPGAAEDDGESACGGVDAAAAQEQADVDAFIRGLHHRLRAEAARAAGDRALLLRESLASRADVMLWGPSHPLLPPPILVERATPASRPSPHHWAALALGVPLLSRALGAIPLIAPSLLQQAPDDDSGADPRVVLPSISRGVLSAIAGAGAASAARAPLLGPAAGETLSHCLGVSGSGGAAHRPLLTLSAVSLSLPPDPEPALPPSEGAETEAAAPPESLSGVFLLPLWHPKRLVTPGAASSVPPALLLRRQPLVYAGPGSGVFAANAAAALRLRCDGAPESRRVATPPPPLPPLPSETGGADGAPQPEARSASGGGVGRFLAARRAQLVEFLRERAVKLYPPRAPAGPRAEQG